MKTNHILLTLMAVLLSSMYLMAQEQSATVRYEGEWPSGDGILYSEKEGLIIGTFEEGRPEGRCVCYKPNGEVYWGDFRKGKATGHGRIYRDNGIVIAGEYKDGKYHGIDTLYRTDGSVLVGRFRKGKLKDRTFESATVPATMAAKPKYPMVDLRRKQEEFLKELELSWEYRNIILRKKAGLLNPKFQGGDIDDFALWVNTQVAYPMTGYGNRSSRTVIVEFVVLKDGTVSDAHAVFGTDPVLNEAAVKAVSRSPKWEPAEIGGEKKDVRLRVPVVFSND